MSEQKHRARKRFGQHFLLDGSVLQRMLAAFAPLAGQRILEIGPGLGALTDALVAHPARSDFSLSAVEFDRDLVRRLRARYSLEQIQIIHADILNFDLAEIVDDSRTKLRIIGNLPYNISTPLIFHLLAQVAEIDDMMFMLQREVALRLAAAPASKNYGRLSVMASLHLDCEMLFDVPPQAFSPPPKVMSTVLRLTPKKNPLRVGNRQVFNAVVAAAFSQRRKTLRNALSQLAQSEHFITAGISSNLRAEALSVQDYIALADVLAARDG